VAGENAFSVRFRASTSQEKNKHLLINPSSSHNDPSIRWCLWL